MIRYRANDNSNDVTLETFTDNLSSFVDRLRTQYSKQPIFVFSPWGWANSDGVSPFSVYYESAYSGVVNQKYVGLSHLVPLETNLDKRNAAGDKNVFLVNTTGWVGYDGVSRYVLESQWYFVDVFYDWCIGHSERWPSKCCGTSAGFH